MNHSKEHDVDKNERADKLKQLGLITAIIIVGFLLYRNISLENSNPSMPTFIESSTETESELSSAIIVHIKGEVVNPGVYQVGGDYRLKDAIDCAGGLTANANTDALNLAMFINDGDEIIIPSKDGTLAVNSSDSSRGLVVSNSSEYNGTKLNINIATVEQLSTLPGIGKSLAEQIVQYRTHIKFNSPEDIKNVPGIGSSKYDNIRDYIYVK